ncbi:type IV secretory system conjugative DNA transfer family protein [uncultured Erythrobacter sp.]|uniref:type IV secretory system conjugative DNA transfer family protein n=1 Tax=uncultured Erythrobacter sp. TaxID=263913 RepID=UPI0026338FBB|nr:type IV secretory system conjugative DNA transfer family protein [uncultured Erythrobacter sp.]
MDIQNDINRFGSARIAEHHEIVRAGLTKQTPSALFLGFHEGKPLWYHGAGGVLLIAGARGGKLATVLGYNLCHSICSRETLVVLDLKGECAAISQNQTPDDKHCIYWNPCGLHGLPRNRVNPLDYIRSDSPTLIADIKVLCENMITQSGGNNSGYFTGRAREFLEGIAVARTKLDGVLTFPALYATINLIPTNNEAWLDFAYEMHVSGYPLSQRIEEEIAMSRESRGDGGGFQGILGELFRAFTALSDPVLMDSVSPPYDFSFADLCAGDQRYQVALMPPAEYIAPWASVIKAMFVAGMLYKSRSPQSPRQTWILDECAQLGGFPLVTKLFTYAAGIGIRPLAVFQSADQMRAIGQDAESIIPSSASLRLDFAIRDIGSAQALSNMLGVQTLEYDDEHGQARARFAKQQAAQSIMMGGDPMEAALAMRHHKQMATQKTKSQRYLRTPDEILNMPDDKMFVFVDGLAAPIYATRKPYWEQRFMAGRFHPNPYHPPLDSVRVKTLLGHKMRPVITEPVPARHAHLPQYQSGMWSYVRT